MVCSHGLNAGAAFGAAGQRCMAISAAVFVGGMERWRQPLVEAAKSLKVGFSGSFQLATVVKVCMH